MGWTLEELQAKIQQLMQESDPDSTLFPRYVDLAGEALYHDLAGRFADHFGRFVRINVLTAEYVIADTLLGAMDEFESLYGTVPSWGTQIVAY